MDPVPEAPLCAHQLHVGSERDQPESTLVCSCPAGLIHMHDCPATLGLTCRYFRDLEGEPEKTLPLTYEALHTELMDQYLLQTYAHRVRSLGDEDYVWTRRREDWEAHYAGDAPADDPDPDDAEIEHYEQERDRLIGLRRKREEARKAQEERSREERARERARMGIKTVVEKARDAVAARGDEPPSLVDELRLPRTKEPAEPAPEGEPDQAPRKRRRRGKRGGAKARGRPDRKPEGEAPPRPPEGETRAESGAEPRKRRRRRRRRKPRDAS